MGRVAGEIVRSKMPDAPRPLDLDPAKVAVLVHRARTDIRFFAREFLGLGVEELPDGLTMQQVEIGEALVKHKRVAVRSGNGLGKTCFAAITILWFVCTRPSLVFSTGPTNDHVKTKLWGEVRRLWLRARIPLGGELQTMRLKIGPKWEAIGMSTRDESNFQGGHEQHLLVVFDEAQAVNPDIWEGAESMMLNADARWLVIGNPLEARGHFYQCFRKRAEWFPVTLSALEHPNYIHRREIVPGATSYQWVEERRLLWGEKDPRFIARVLGEFPDGGSDRVVPLSFLETAAKRAASDIEAPSPEEGVHLGVDVARYGTDETVIAVVLDGLLVQEIRLSSMNGPEVAGHVLRTAKAHGLDQRESRQRIHVDVTGVGASVVDFLKDMGWPCDGLAFSESPREDWPDLTSGMECANLRAELYWVTRERLRTGSLAVPEEFGDTWEELSEPGYRFPRGKLLVEDKEDVKKRLSRSPDGADALVLAQARRPQAWTGVIVG